MKGKNDELDARVLMALSRAVHCKFSELRAKLPDFKMRDLDRALQRLRKAGKAKFFARHGWIKVQAGS
jgi:DNA-binding HxlR family transcriptional regulator